jgi:gingipain R
MSLGSQAQVRVLANTSTYTELEIQLPQVQKSKLVQNGKTYLSLSAANATPWLYAQHPDVLKYMLRVALPANKNASVVMLAETHTDEVLPFDVIPSTGHRIRNANATPIIAEEGSIYASDAFFPSQVINPGATYAIRSQRGQNFALAFTQYNAAQKTLRTYTSMRIRVNYDKPVDGNAIPAFVPKQESEQMLAVLKNKFDNFEPSEYTALSQYGEMLVVCAPQYLNNIAPYVAWKNQKGIKTALVSTAAISSASGALNKDSLYNYIKSYYASHPNLLYLQLVGSQNDIETQRLAYASTPNYDYYGDNRYGYLVGNDNYAEVLVGRFYCLSEQDLDLQIKKTLRYEQQPNMGAWLRNYTAIGSNDATPADDNQYDWQHMRDIADSMKSHGNYLYVWELYDGDKGGADAVGAPTPTMLTNCLDSGTSFINYTGHGNVNSISTCAFTSVDADYTNNTDGQWPAMLTVGCNTGMFEAAIPGKCFGYAMASASKTVGTEVLPLGTIANAMSSEEQWWEAPPQCQDEAMAVLRGARPGNVKNAFGSIMQCGWASMMDQYSAAAGWQYPDDGNQMTDAWQVFGDISVVLFNKNEGTLACTHPGTIHSAHTTFTVNCSQDDADVCLSYQNKVLATAKSSGGTAQFSFASGLLAFGDSIIVTATKFNHTPYQGKVYINGWATGLSTQALDISIVPNPATNTIAINTSANIENVAITDITGKLVLSSNNKQIDIQLLQAGLYNVVVNTNAGSITKKLLKQ